MCGAVGHIETTDSENKRKIQMYFLICESCFWCASALNLHLIDDETIPRCPLCEDSRTKAIPILGGYKFEYA